MDTREVILETALDLFNRNGASAVTTRHIADRMKISPGNLYYHYRNREEIVRVLMQRMIDEFSSMFSMDILPENHIMMVNRFIDIPVSVMYRYRFFYREPVILLERDPILKKMYYTVKKNRINEFRRLFRIMATSGFLMKNITDGEFEAGFNNMWSLNEFIIQAMYMNNEKITEENMKKNFMRIMHILRPFIHEKYIDAVFPQK